MSLCKDRSCGFFGSGGFIIFEITEGQVREGTQPPWCDWMIASPHPTPLPFPSPSPSHPLPSLCHSPPSVILPGLYACAQANYEIYELLPVLLLGVVGGLLGASFVVLNARLGTLRRRCLARFGARGKVAEALAVSLLTSAVSFSLPLMAACQVRLADWLGGGGSSPTPPTCLDEMSRSWRVQV
jgi:hypothetical protein